jgi:hypothetical protein
MKVIAVCDNQRKLLIYRAKLEDEYFEEHAFGVSPYNNLIGKQSHLDLGGIFY